VPHIVVTTIKYDCNNTFIWYTVT